MDRAWMYSSLLSGHEGETGVARIAPPRAIVRSSLWHTGHESVTGSHGSPIVLRQLGHELG